MANFLNNISDEELKLLVKESKNWNNLSKKLGYKNGPSKALRNRIANLNISINHFNHKQNEDLTNKRFGNLTVIRKTNNKTKSGEYYWLCKCDCGNEKEIRSSLLRNGSYKTCGCAINLIKDLTGKRFGKLIVLKKSNNKSINNRTLWVCKCDCGNICEVRTDCLISKTTQSCGCLISKGENKIANLLLENNIEFENQKTFDSCRFKKTNKLARFDFYLPKENYLIEYDGIQHASEKVNGWLSEEKIKYTKEHDKFKNNWCKENNIPLIRIPYTHYNDLCIEDLKLETSKFII